MFILTGITPNVFLYFLSSIHLRCQILPLSYLLRAIVRILRSQFRHIVSFVQCDYQTPMGDDGWVSIELSFQQSNIHIKTVLIFDMKSNHTSK